MHITLVKEITDEIYQTIERLIPQLSTSLSGPTRSELEEIATNDYFLIARDPDENGPMVGSLTLIIFRVPTGLRAWIEDVVVDESMRGKGIGEGLTRAALELARELGVRTVDLTSRPTREAANRLYQRVGFKLRQTNLYRYDL